MTEAGNHRSGGEGGGEGGGKDGCVDGLIRGRGEGGGSDGSAAGLRCGLRSGERVVVGKVQVMVEQMWGWHEISLKFKAAGGRTSAYVGWYTCISAIELGSNHLF